MADRVIGTDVSFYQDDPQTPQGINFTQMRSNNAGFAIIRAGQNLWIDRDFKVNWREARAAGIPRGSYWFYDSRIEPKQQAKLWASVFNGDYGELPLWADFEDNYNGKYKGWKHWYDFIEHIKQLVPTKEIGVYTNYYYWKENTVQAGIPSSSLNYFKQYPLWVAAYNPTGPTVPQPWTDWTLWQFTDNGDGFPYGVESKNIDLNYFNGDLQKFRQRFNLSDSPLPEPIPSNDYRVTASPSLKVREAPNTNAEQVGKVYFNEIVEKVDQNGDGSWLKIKRKNGKLTGWSFAAYLQRLSASPVPTPDPDPEPEPEPEPQPNPGAKFYKVIASPSLRVRSGPGTNYPQVGSVLKNEIVREVDANSNRSWLKIRELDGNLVGWVSSEYLELTNAPTPEPEPEPEPEPNPTPIGKWYRCTASPSLRLRSGAGTNFPQIGSVLFNDIVEEVEVTADGLWLKVRKLDGIIGWASAEYLVPTNTPDNPTPPDDEDKDWYRVTAAPSLKVREGPGLEYDSIGLVYFGQLVEKISSNLDGTWFKIRNADGSLIGWSTSEYLISAGSSTPEPTPPPVTIPDHKDKTWYKVTVASVNMRESASPTASILGKILKNDTVPALDDTSTDGWVQIQKLDGLIGWVTKDTLLQIGNTRPASVLENLYSGITYTRKDLTIPRPLVIHVLAIDLQNQKLEFLVTPSNSDVICSRTTSTFLDEFKLHIAINGGYFSYLDASYDPQSLCPKGGEPVRISDYAASRGSIYSNKRTAQPVVHIGRKNQINFTTYGKNPGFGIFNAISGDRMVVVNGAVVKNLAALAPAPRTAVGLSKNGRWLTFMVIDGRQEGYSEGATLTEVGELLLSYGVHTGVNMDGGGSSAMVIRGSDTKARAINSPIDLGQPGQQRRVGNHLGIFVKA